MKKLLVSFVLLLGISFSVLADDDRPVSVESLPAEIKQFVTTYFSGKKITYATRDRDSYDVLVENGVKLEFTSGGQWKEVKGYNLAENVLGLLPANAVTYLRTNYKDTGIAEVKKERYGYQVKLGSGLEVLFNHEGSFIGYDD